MRLELIAFLILFTLCNVKSLLVKLQERCVPTLTVRGPCHVCVCDADGVFICQPLSCPKTRVNPRKSFKGECQKHVTYRFKELFCSCNYDGRWMSFNCRETFQILKPDRAVVKSNLRSNLTCTPHTLFLIDCNICQCDTAGVILPASCTNRPCNNKGHKTDICKFGDFLRTYDEICLCSDINYYIDQLCVKVGDNILQEISRTDVAMITNNSHIRKNMDSHSCVPHKEYKIDCNRCICDAKKELVCTNESCDFKTPLRSGVENKENEDFYTLPKATDDRDCEPGQKYRMKCNTCVCSHNRMLSCTTMLCLEDFVLDEQAIAASLLPIN